MTLPISFAVTAPVSATICLRIASSSAPSIMAGRYRLITSISSCSFWASSARSFLVKISSDSWRVFTSFWSNCTSRVSSSAWPLPSVLTNKIALLMARIPRKATSSLARMAVLRSSLIFSSNDIILLCCTGCFSCRMICIAFCLLQFCLLAVHRLINVFK